MQRKIEAAGFSSITISPIAETTAAVGAPRVAAVEHPLSQTMGKPGDKERQRAVLLAALEALESIEQPGETLHLPFRWHEPRAVAIKNSYPRRAPPITRLIKQKPWLLAKFLRGRLPKP